MSSYSCCFSAPAPTTHPQELTKYNSRDDKSYVASLQLKRSWHLIIQRKPKVQPVSSPLLSDEKTEARKVNGLSKVTEPLVRGLVFVTQSPLSLSHCDIDRYSEGWGLPGKPCEGDGFFFLVISVYLGELPSQRT